MFQGGAILLQVDSDVIGCSVMADGTTVQVLDTYNVAEFRNNVPDDGNGVC